MEGAGDWEVVLCDLCGGNGSHLDCWESEEATYVWRDVGGNGPELEVRDQTIITINSSLNATVELNSTMDSSLETQQRTHECVTCGKVFGTRSNLSQYMRSHNKIGREKMISVPSVLSCNNCKKL